MKGVRQNLLEIIFSFSSHWTQSELDFCCSLFISPHTVIFSFLNMGRSTKRSASSIAKDESRMSNMPVSVVATHPSHVSDMSEEATDQPTAKRTRKSSASASSSVESSKQVEQPVSKSITKKGNSKKSVSDSLSLVPEEPSDIHPAQSEDSFPPFHQFDLDPTVLSALQPPTPIPSIRSVGISAIQQQQKLQQKKEEREKKQREQEEREASEQEANASFLLASRKKQVSFLQSNRSGGRSSDGRDYISSASNGRTKSSGHMDEKQSNSTSSSSISRDVQRSRLPASIKDAGVQYMGEEVDGSEDGSEDDGAAAEVAKPTKRKPGRPPRVPKDTSRGEPLFLGVYEELIAKGGRLLPSKLNCWECHQWKSITAFSSSDFKKITRKCYDCLRASAIKKAEAELIRRAEKGGIQKENGGETRDLLKELKMMKERLVQEEQEKKDIIAKMNEFFIKVQKDKIQKAGSWEDVTPRPNVRTEFNTRDHRMQVNGPDGMLDTKRIEMPWNGPDGKPEYRIAKGASGSDIVKTSLKEVEAAENHVSRTHSSNSSGAVHFPVSPIIEVYRGDPISPLYDPADGEQPDEERKGDE